MDAKRQRRWEKQFDLFLLATFQPCTRPTRETDRHSGGGETVGSGRLSEALWPSIKVLQSAGEPQARYHFPALEVGRVVLQEVLCLQTKRIKGSVHRSGSPLPLSSVEYLP